MLAPSLGRCAATKTSPCALRLGQVVLESRAPYRSALASRRRAHGTRTHAAGGSSTETKKSPSAGPLIKRSEEEGSSTMERVRVWAGMPSEGAVERLSVICAHCNAQLTPSQMDYACAESRLLPELREKFRALTRLSLIHI